MRMDVLALHDKKKGRQGSSHVASGALGSARPCADSRADWRARAGAALDDGTTEQTVGVRLKGVRVENGRQFGQVYLALALWRACQLDRFAAEHILRRTGIGDLLQLSDALVNKDRLYRALDQLLVHKGALEAHLSRRVGELFAADNDVLLYDVTSTYFEGMAEGNPPAQRGYSRDHRGDCKQVWLVGASDDALRLRRPGVVELPAVLGLEPQAERLLELERRRGDAAARKAHQEARRNHRALAERRRPAARDVAPMQEKLAVQIGRHAELPVGRDHRGKAPRQPALRPSGRELERCDERERIARGFLRPQQHRRRVARLRGGDGGMGGVELLLRDGAESDPARFHAAIIS